MYIYIILVLISCKASEDNHRTTYKNGEIITVDFEGLQEYIETHTSQTLVINFWATWCKPCVKELPAFETLRSQYEDKDLTVILVSLDFPEQMDNLKNFVKRKNLQSELVFLDDGNANEWIPKIDKEWSGAIPATLIVTDEQKDFYERSFSFSELEKVVIAHTKTLL